MLYKTCHPEQLERINEFVNCEVYNNNKIYECDVCICETSWNGHPDTVKAKKYIQMIHANYEELKRIGYIYKKWEKTTEHLAVSKTVQRIFNEIYNYNSELMYNILDDKKETKPILKLISATRLSAEKGYNRMIKLAEELKKANIKFRWLIFTDLKMYNINKPNIEEFIFMEPRYDIWDYIAEADYGVQLSDTEGYSYFVNECLQYGTPMLITNFDSAFESVKDGYNGYILDMNLSNLDINKIITQIPKDFIYTPKTTIKDWCNYLGGAEFKKREVKKITMKLKILKSFDDKNTGKRYKINEIITFAKERGEELLKHPNNLVELIPEPKIEEPKKRSKKNAKI